MNALAGIISPCSAPALTHPPHRMFERLCHDPACVVGYRSFERLGVRVGWTTPRTTLGCAIPAWSRSGHVALFFAGEEFSAHVSPPAAGDRLTRGAAALAAIADDYEHTGHAALRQLNGWFSGLIVDLRDDTVTLFNDRYGLGRIYYHDSAHGFFFSSEAKSLLAVLPQLRRIDPRGLAEVFAVGCVMQNRSLFAGIALLPPGAAWTFRRDGRIEKRRYFDPAEWEQQEPLDRATYGERLHEVFAAIARRYVRGTARVGLSLTGGLDSRAVMAWSGVEPGALPCYTFGGPYRDCADVAIARRLAGVCHHPHTTIRVDQDFFPAFSTLAERAVYLSDGSMDVSGAVELHVNRQARAIAPVRLTGNYGSEILRSHVAFRPARIDRTIFTPEFNTLLDEAAQTYRAEAACHRLTFIAFKQVPWHHYARFAVEKSQLTPRSPFLDNDLVALAYRAPAELRGSPEPLLRLIAEGNPQLAAIDTDRALRARRVPLFSNLARLWREFTAKAEYAYDYGMPRWLARTDRAMSRLHLEKLFLGRHKFYHFRIWYRDPLRHVVREHGESASSESAGGCYRAGAPRRIVEEHLSGRANRTLELHRLLSLQLVDRLLLRSP